MLGNFARVDAALIDRVCQPMIDWIDQKVAVDCFWVARTCIDVSALAWIVSQASGAASLARFAIQGPEVIQFALIVLGLGAVMVLRRTFERPAGGHRPNPLRAAMVAHRLSSLVWLAGLLAKTATMSFGLASLALLAVGSFATVALYVGACSAPPPKRREFRIGEEQWRMALSRSD
jgi:hypothetical protein